MGAPSVKAKAYDGPYPRYVVSPGSWSLVRL